MGRHFVPPNEEHTSSSAARRRRSVSAFFTMIWTCAALLVAARPCAAEWLDAFEPQGPSGQVRALLAWNDALVAGGTFGWCAGVRAAHVARWTSRGAGGGGWSALGAGVPFVVSSLVLFEGELIAAGDPIDADAPSIARWDGSTWRSLAAPGGAISALAVHDGSLVAAGWFEGGHAVLRLEGDAWAPVGDGLNARARALAVIGGRLVAGGDFDAHVSAWDGGAWSPLGEGLDGPAYALLADGTSLVVGGDFGRAGGTEAHRVAIWREGHWRPLGTGLDDVVRVLAADDAGIVAGGWFRPDGAGGPRHLARWNGRAWTGVSGGREGAVLALGRYGGSLVAGGDGAAPEAGEAPVFLARLHGGAWTGVGGGAPLDERVLSIAITPDGVLAGGQFTRAGGVAVAHVARWDGRRWHALGAGTDGRVFAVAEVPGGAIAGGDFTRAGETAATRIARWDGRTWHALGDGLDGTVMCAAMYDGAVVVGGLFTRSGLEHVSHLARFAEGRWEPFGGGADGAVYQARVVDGALVVAGEFTHLGREEIPFVARWTGAGWEPVGAPLDGPVFAVTTFPEPGAGGGPTPLVIGGAFSGTRDGPLELVARWDGTALSPLGGGLAALSQGAQPFVQALAVIDGRVVAAGEYLAVLDGAVWTAFEGGANGRVNALGVGDGTLYVGGSFTLAGGRRTPYLVAWRAER